MSILFLESAAGSGDAVARALEESKMGEIIRRQSLAELRSFVENASLTGIELLLLEPGLADAGIPAVCQFISGVEALRDLPVILVNRNLPAEEIDSLTRAGVDDYISDPANSVELLSRVRMAQKLSRARAAIREGKNGQLRFATPGGLSRREVQYDPVTGLFSQEYFMELLVKEWKRAFREERSLSLILADIDKFKSYQRVCGEDAGELCVIKVGRTIASELKRPGDIVAHFEGDCFAVLLPETDNLGATVIAEIIRSAVGSMRIPHPASTVTQHITISLGAASAEFKTDSTPETLIRQARLALQYAKQDGRNRVENLY